MITSDQRIAELREFMAVNRRRIARIKRLQSSLNIRLHTAQVMYERFSVELWELEHGHKLVRQPAQFTEHQASRVTAELVAFNPTVTKPSRKR